MKRNLVNKLPALISFLVVVIVLPVAVFLVQRETKYKSQAYDENSIFGTTHEKELTPEIAETMSQAGIKWIRIFFKWEVIEPENWQFDFSKMDEELDLYLSKGIQPYANITKTPSWAEIEHAPYTGDCSGVNYPPLGWQWRHFLKQVVGRYGCGEGGKCQIHHWEIYFEENGSCSFLDQNNSANVNEYLKILKIANEEIKKIDPQAKIVLGRLLPSSNRLDFLKNLKNKGAGQYFDIVSFGGPYGCGKNQQLKNNIKEMRSVFPDKEIWATEVVCASNYNDDGEEERCEPDPTGEAIQAQQLRDWYQIAQEENIGKLFWQSYSDRIYWPKDQKRCTGLVRHNYTLKEAYLAYQQIATVTPSPPPSTPPSGGSGKIAGNVWIDLDSNGRQHIDNETVYICSGSETQKIKLELYRYNNPDTPIQVSELNDGNYYQFSKLEADQYRIKIAQTPTCDGKQYSPSKWRLVAASSKNDEINISNYCSSSYWGTCLNVGEAPATERWWPLEVIENEITNVYLGIKPK